MTVRYYLLIFIAIMATLLFGSYALTRAYFADTAVSASNTFTTATSFGEDDEELVSPTPINVEKLVINEVSAEGSDDWIELYNPSGNNIKVENWKVQDNTGLPEIIPGDTNVGAGERAVIIGKDSTLTFPAAVHIFRLSTVDIGGSGLNPAGDRILLYDDTDVVIDQLGWGTNTTTPTLPAIPAGQTLQRKTDGLDTDTVNDWELGTPSAGLTNN